MEVDHMIKLHSQNKHLNTELPDNTLSKSAMIHKKMKYVESG